jgi:hypothetical protein
MKIQLSETSKSFRISINGITHLQLKYEGLIGFQSYIDDAPVFCNDSLKVKSKVYFIEFYYDNNSNVIKCEYSKEELWKEVIRLVNKLIF